ncbi:MAG: cysteine desulfurase [Parvibaculum sp.]|jgi:cysteine desulfurase|uniref:cysteine desulfurase family protein n=1 Tax=Parvibaculum sp. TaxID=2024848 RepID=UPI000C577FB9|nr:cysteine desulfurase family protein [Parvibaculum sp.]MAU60616.1 cysteine desulfurase [Parvibaculum sp.]|tara:strand:- start:12172 stop:13365 length:1194 start_codon:yes stop_codon:yes gene_type:complete
MTIKRAYMDHNATTPLRPEARAAVIEALDVLGNPSSVHTEGRAARALVERARRDVASLVGARPAEIVFTSGGTEAAAMAIHAAGAALGVKRLIVSAVEHDAVLSSAEASGLPVSLLPVDREGRADMAVLEAMLAASGGPALVALMHANNETGVLQAVAEASALAHAAGSYLLCDAVQAAGKVALDFDALGADMMMLGGHKIGAPTGVGALVVRTGLPFAARSVGGGQEARRRAGSENVSGIAGFGAAAGASINGLGALSLLRDELEAGIARRAPDAVFFGAGAERLPNTSYLSAPGMDAETLLMSLDLDGIAVSAGAACSSGKIGKPRVLDAMGIPDELSRGAIRVSLGWTSDKADVERFLESWLRAYERVRVRTANMNTGVTAGGTREVPLAAVES